MILVACKLPNGLTLDGTKGENSITLNGQNTTYVPGAPGLTNLDDAEWLYLKMTYASHPAFKNNAIFATGTDKVADVIDMAEELQDERTGLEGLDPNKPGAKLEPVDPAKLQQALNVTAAGGRPRKSVASKADRAAAVAAAEAAGQA